jgi:hypothetical protein
MDTDETQIRQANDHGWDAAKTVASLLAFSICVSSV